jgi:hypothetical protein
MDTSKKAGAMETINTGCLCGGVQLRIAGEPIAEFYCHCDDCQAVTGGGYSRIALFPADSVATVGDGLSSWTYKTLPRVRCSTCGTLLYGEPPGLGMRGVNASLLPAGKFQPTFHNQCKYALMPVQDDLPHYIGAPPMFGGSDETTDW